MRTTVTIDDDLIEQAMALSGTRETSALVRQGLRALIEQESARRLAKTGWQRPLGHRGTARPRTARPEAAPPEYPRRVILIDTSVWILGDGATLWTRDPRLSHAAFELGVGWMP